VEPTALAIAQARQAAKAKAVRFLSLPGAPFGALGDGEGGMGVAMLRPDYAIRELLFGLSVYDWTAAVTSDVIIDALGGDHNYSSAYNGSEISRARDAAVAWVLSYLASGPVGIA
jgi:hypothetical protein